MSTICNLCPRMCGKPRGELSGEGYCGMGTRPVIARAALHFDEEPCISGTRGSGAVFFSGCALQCAYCQNDQIARGGYGRPVENLRGVFDALIAQGAQNINLVTASHFAPAALSAIGDGLPVPVVWNCGGYERAETLRSLEGRVQVYLPDFKYPDEAGARRYSCAPDYPDVAKAAILEMARQVGPVQLDENGAIQGGLIVRHLILPGRAAQSILALDWIAKELPKGTWVSLMAQYVPVGRAKALPPLDRRVTRREYDRVVDRLFALGLEDGYVQELSSAEERYIPAFDLTGVP